ncbi:amidohydrolase family protein [Halorussus salilacus]|uniref:amidohydrolase family protein n=1 Tax=Halorussus salilacus TaxID=2953750 RepID=UPI00209DE762|nr:amidohydrolase family protein [Halorussus salilacus]USZ66708.1 amidohydrolase family protein [Halorussus salilacus]
MDTLVRDTTLLTFRDDALGIVENGALGISGDEIAYVGPASQFEGSADTVIDGSGAVTIPGLVNAHAHTRHTLLRGGAQDVPEIEWMNRALGPLANHATPEDEVVGSRLGVLEAVRGGVTTIAEYSGEVGRLVEEVYRPLGVRTVAVETVNEVPDDRADLGPRELYPFDRGKGEAALDRAEALFERYGDDPLVAPAYGPQALDMVSADLLAEICSRAREYGRDVHMHVAQGERERLQVEERYGREESTVSVLDDMGVLDDFLVAVHCHGTTPGERERLVEGGARMVANPSSIGMIDGEVPPVADYLDRGGIAGVGTDQAPGPGHHDLLREARTASLLSKVESGDPTALPSWKALRLATVEGAEALGIADEVGTLEEGTKADIVTVDVESLGIAPTVSEPFHTAVPNLVHSTTGREVRDVFVAGEPILRDGEFVDADPEAVVAEATERATRIFADAEDDWRAADSELVARADEGWL